MEDKHMSIILIQHVMGRAAWIRGWGWDTIPGECHLKMMDQGSLDLRRIDVWQHDMQQCVMYRYSYSWSESTPINYTIAWIH